MRETSSSTSTSSRMQFGRAGVDAGQLEQVHDHLVEPTHLPDHDVERLLGALRQVGPAAVEHFDGGCERRDRRAQLVADVGGEARLALEPGLHGVGHVVERLRQAGQIGVGLRSHAGVEAAGGDLAGSGGDTGDRSQQAAAGRPTQAPRRRAWSPRRRCPARCRSCAEHCRCRCSGIASKYWAWAAGMLMPTAMYGSPSTLNRCVAPTATGHLVHQAAEGTPSAGNAASPNSPVVGDDEEGEALACCASGSEPGCRWLCRRGPAAEQGRAHQRGVRDRLGFG